MKQSEIVNINSLGIEIVEYGERNNFPILFFHGFGSSAGCLVPDFDLLQELGLYILAIQRPGTGCSDFYMPRNLSEYSTLVKSILDELKIAKAHLIGWSAGGLFAQAFSANYPERVASLSLISSAIPFYNLSSRSVLPLKWKLNSSFNRILPSISKLMFAIMAKQLLKNPKKVFAKAKKELPPADQEVLRSSDIDEAFSKAVVESFRNKGLGPFFDISVLCAKQTVPLKNISAPTYIWHGTEDKTWPIQFAAYLHDQIPNAKLHIISNAGHLLIMSQWNEIVRTAANLTFQPNS